MSDLPARLATLIEKWRERSAASIAENEFLVSPGFDVQRCADDLAAALVGAEPPADQWQAFDGSLTIRFLQYINAKRAERWCGRGPVCLNCKCDCRRWEDAETVARKLGHWVAEPSPADKEKGK